MKLVYENQRGKITMSGGGSDGFNITDIRGLSLPENDISAVRYPNSAGRVVTKSTPIERVITISGDVRDDGKKHINKAFSVLSQPGVMHITSYGKTKKIECRCIGFEPGKRRGVYIPFTVQFCADNPYFSDIYDTKTNISKREGKLSSPFVLGCVFSERLTENAVINNGDISIEPVFTITSAEGTVCPNGILIKNKTNQCAILLKTDIEAGEVITVDVKNRTIKSSTRGNIISCIGKETSLSRFLIDVGVSKISISASGSDGKIVSYMTHNNNYVSIVI